MSEYKTVEGLPDGFPNVDNPKYWRGPHGAGPDSPDYDPDNTVFYVRDYIRDVKEWFKEQGIDTIGLGPLDTSELDKDEEIECDKCPVCGSGGCRAVYHDPLLDKDVTHFYCDEDQSHHFLIVHLDPYEEVEMEEPV